jgi:hypothetical protein
MKKHPALPAEAWSLPLRQGLRPGDEKSPQDSHPAGFLLKASGGLRPQALTPLATSAYSSIWSKFM